MLRTVFLISLLCVSLYAAGQADLQIMNLEPTVLFPNAQPLHQVALLKVLNSASHTITCQVEVSVNDSLPEEQSAHQIAPGLSTIRVLIPDISSPQPVHVEIKADQTGKVLAGVIKEWEPQRKWKVYIVESSHEDLGYEDFIYKKQHDIANYIDIASRLSNPAMPMGHGDYHYTLETLIFMRNYIEERSERAWRNLVDKQLKTGQMELMGAPSGVHSHWMDYEELARMTYSARREVFDRYGLDLKTFMIVDNPSLSWSGAEALSDAGFRYVARWGQGWRTGGNNDYQHTKLPALFWWVAPDGVHKVLYGWRSHYSLSFWYGQQESGHQDLSSLASINVDKELKGIQDGTQIGPYPYDAVIYPSYVDHGVPHVDESALPKWRQEYAYPKIFISSPTPFFEYIERQYGDKLPVLTGDLNNFSADYATIDPESQAWKRQAARALPVAEGLSAITSYLDLSHQSVVKKAADIWTQIFDYDEHSWPTQPPANDIHLFNAAWVKKQGAERAFQATKTLLNSNLASLSSQIPSSGQKLVVFNSLAHQRDDLVSFSGYCSSVEDLTTHDSQPCEQGISGGSIFIARNVPAYGYKVYSLSSTRSTPASPNITATQDSISNQFYNIRFDPKTGNVRSIVDKKSGRELVDTAAKYQFNQMVYVHKNQRESKEGFEYSPARARLVKSRLGPVSAAFDSWVDDSKTGAAIHQTVILYDGLPRIDIVDNLQHARVLFSRNYEDRYRENIFYAFPISVPDGQPRAEYAGGVVRPYDDQLRWGSHDYLNANRWVDVSNSSFGVTIAPWNEAIFSFGEIRYNQFSINYKPKTSYLFSYAWSNRMAGLLTLNGNDCNATFRYSVRAHEGDWNSGQTTAFGWSIASPLIASTIQPNSNGALDPNQSSFLSLDASNVQLTVLKQAEQPGRGWIVRLVETEGKPTEVSLRSNLFPITDAYQCDLVENDLHKLEVTGHTITARILPYGFLTLRLVDGHPPEEMNDLRATAVSGEKTDLRWNSSGAGLRYNVFRSLDPEEPATAYSLIATTSESEFHDDGLTPGTTYYYRVAAVTRENLGGPPSAPAAVTTLTSNLEPPASVKDLSVIRLAPDRLLICWRKSPNADTARYYVYRGDRPDFRIGARALAVIPKSGYFLETYTDEHLQAGHKYFYKVLAEDWSGKRQQESPVASAITPEEEH